MPRQTCKSSATIRTVLTISASRASVKRIAQPQLTLGNDNLGGVAVGKSTTSAHLATITNQGAQPLTISSVLVEPGGASFTLTGVPATWPRTPSP